MNLDSKGSWARKAKFEIILEMLEEKLGTDDKSAKPLRFYEFAYDSRRLVLDWVCHGVFSPQDTECHVLPLNALANLSILPLHPCQATSSS